MQQNERLHQKSSTGFLYRMFQICYLELGFERFGPHYFRKCHLRDEIDASKATDLRSCTGPGYGGLNEYENKLGKNVVWKRKLHFIFLAPAFHALYWCMIMTEGNDHDRMLLRGPETCLKTAKEYRKN